MSLNDTPRADRLHIALFGRRNSGKSSLINELTGQGIALVSDHPGTTTDPVYKAMEMAPLGPVVFIDTAGFDDEGDLGELRVERTREVTDRTDIAILVVDPFTSCEDDFAYEREWLQVLRAKQVPVIVAMSKVDLASAAEPDLAARLIGEDLPAVSVSSRTGDGVEALRQKLMAAVPEDFYRRKIFGDLVSEGSLVLLVMPQDIQAPKGRLILPQVQTIRESLDRKCTTVATTADGLKQALECLSRDPDLIVTDSQCFPLVHEMKPASSRLTSFSVLFAAYKGDLSVLVDGASQIDDMTENSKVLIAEACTHVPLEEDIGTVKIPNLLRKRIGEALQITNVRGKDFPSEEDLTQYDLIIHCGACMFNRAHVMSRIAQAQRAGVPITNYGIVLAKCAGILDDITLPE